MPWGMTVEEWRKREAEGVRITRTVKEWDWRSGMRTGSLMVATEPVAKMRTLRDGCEAGDDMMWLTLGCEL